MTASNQSPNLSHFQAVLAVLFIGLPVPVAFGSPVDGATTWILVGTDVSGDAIRL